jgi:hypothetical protein
MSDHLSTRIEDTKRAIVRNELLMKSHPAPSVEANLRSFQKLLRQLESQLASTPLRVASAESSLPFPESNCISRKAP